MCLDFDQIKAFVHSKYKSKFWKSIWLWLSRRS